jgi:hypothetical protein
MDQVSRSPGTSRDTRGLPDGNPSKNKKRSPSDLRREAHRLNERLTDARQDRRIGWPDGKDEYAVGAQERKLSKLHGEKRVLRRAIYATGLVPEGQDFAKHHPGRSR